MGDLAREFGSAILAMTEAHVAELQTYGVSRSVIQDGLVGIARMIVDGSTYQPNENGALGYITPIRVVDAAMPWLLDDLNPSEVVRVGDLIDLAAWHPARPGDWALRRDVATHLGCLEPQLLSSDPVAVFRSPLTWLRAGAIGLCPLTRRPRELQSLLLQFHAIEAEDNDHAAQVSAFLRYPISIPPISVRNKRHMASA